MNRNQMFTYGGAAIGAIAGFMLHKKYPKFGMAGKVGYIAIGGGLGWYAGKKVGEMTAKPATMVTSAAV